MTVRFGSLVVAAAVTLAGGALGAQNPSAPPTQAAPTFSKDVAPILYDHCVSCHRPGEIGPMSLITYTDARPWARSISRKVVSRVMPPWFADPNIGTFSNERRLSQADIDTIVSWVDGGTREGNTADLPPLPQFAEGWQIGKPDIVFEMPVDFNVPAEGRIDIQNFEVPTNFKQDMWVERVEARPGDPAHVHHISVSVIEPPGYSKQPEIMQVTQLVPPDQLPAPPSPRSPQAVRTEGVSHELVTRATGEQPYIFKPGLAKRIAAGSVLSISIHYSANGTPGKDRSKVGLIFAKQPPQYEVGRSAVSNQKFVIPPGAPYYAVESDATVTRDFTLWSIKPHMHWRGKDVKGTITYPDGRTEVLLSVPKFDFGWMLEYVFAEPKKIPKGSKIHVTAHFDNSAGNPVNPDPKATVAYGEQTWEEMMNFQLAFFVDDASVKRGNTKQQQ